MASSFSPIGSYIRQHFLLPRKFLLHLLLVVEMSLLLPLLVVCGVGQETFFFWSKLFSSFYLLLLSRFVSKLLRISESCISINTNVNTNANTSTCAIESETSSSSRGVPVVVGVTLAVEMICAFWYSTSS